MHNIQWVAETISGTKKPAKRKLGSLLDGVEAGDTIICTELSRLGRSLMMILNVLQELLERGVKVVAIKEGYELGDNIQSKVLAFAFGLSAEIERTLLSERTKQGLERARKEGKQIGRLKGQRPKRYKLSGKAAFIRRNRLTGRSKLSLARELGVTWGNSGRQTKVFDKNNVVSARTRFCSPQNSQKLVFYGTAYAKRRNAEYRNRFAFSKAGRTANTVNG